MDEFPASIEPVERTVRVVNFPLTGRIGIDGPTEAFEGSNRSVDVHRWKIIEETGFLVKGETGFLLDFVGGVVPKNLFNRVKSSILRPVFDNHGGLAHTRIPLAESH